ncbi:hypothetical protein F4703DRAFT_1792089 [Phycomyces blakesleeanus]
MKRVRIRYECYDYYLMSLNGVPQEGYLGSYVPEQDKKIQSIWQRMTIKEGFQIHLTKTRYPLTNLPFRLLKDNQRKVGMIAAKFIQPGIVKNLPEQNVNYFPNMFIIHGTTQHNTTKHYTALHSTTQHYIALHSTALHSTTQHYTALHSTTQHYTALHSTAQHYTTLHSTT